MASHFKYMTHKTMLVGDPDKDRSKVFGGDKRRLTKADDDVQGEG